jgi:biopolymer transport protein TolQ
LFTIEAAFDIPYLVFMGISDVNTYSGGLLGLLYSSGPVAKAVVLILAVFSVFSWAIMFFKWRQLRKVEEDGERFLRIVKESPSFDRLTSAYKDNPDSPFYHLLSACYREVSSRRKTGGADDIGRVDLSVPAENAMRAAIGEETERLGSKLSFLATTANAAPFIGLFGTVWGIMDSFREIGLRGTTSLAVVAPGISEALVTTALGLATAIPAVLAYNYMLSRLRRVTSKMENSLILIVNLVGR